MNINWEKKKYIEKDEYTSKIKRVTSPNQLF